MPKISELDIINFLSEDDLFVVVDKETSTTRQIKFSDLLYIIKTKFGLDGDFPLPTRPAVNPLCVNRTAGTTITNPDLSPQLISNAGTIGLRINAPGPIAIDNTTVEKMKSAFLTSGYVVQSFGTYDSQGRFKPSVSSDPIYKWSNNAWQSVDPLSQEYTWVGNITIIPNIDITSLCDAYVVPDTATTVRIQFTSEGFSNRFSMTARNSTTGSTHLLYDTEMEIGATNKLVSVCKPLGYNYVDVKIQSKDGNPFSYVFNIGESCVIASTPPAPTPTVTSTPFATPTPTESPRATPAAPTATPTLTPTISVTPTITPTTTNTPTASLTPSVTRTPTPTSSPTS